MRTTPPIYSYKGLIAGLGLAALVIGVVILIAFTSLPDLTAWIILALGVLLLVTAVVLDYNQVKTAVTGRRGRFSAGNTVMVSVFVGIVLVVNAISYNYSGRYDVTELSQFTLTSQTQNYLAEMEIPVDVLCFFTPTDQYGIGTYATSLLEEYKNHTDLLNVKVVDPDENPDVAKDYNISQYQTVVFESELGRRSVLPSEIYQQAEHSFTSAILEVTGSVQKTVYFLTGHGEATIDGEFAYAALLLMDNLYKVQTLDLMAVQQIPDDCSALIIAGPRQDFTALENRILRDYIDNKGRVLLLVNPGYSTDVKNLLADYYIDIEEGTIVDPGAYYSVKSSPIVPRTQNVFSLTETYFPGAASLVPNEAAPDDIYMEPLLYTSALSWVEKNFVPGEDPAYNESIEKLGSRAIGVLLMQGEVDESGQISEETANMMIIVGDSDFASNQHVYNANNAHQFLYLVEYLTMGEQLVTVERKVLPYRSMVITQDQDNLIKFLSVGLMPFLVLMAGAVIWWTRR